jgi:hypothetical protein
MMGVVMREVDVGREEVNVWVLGVGVVEIWLWISGTVSDI